jgi:hypothetical protein
MRNLKNLGIFIIIFKFVYFSKYTFQIKVVELIVNQLPIHNSMENNLIVQHVVMDMLQFW